TFSTNSYDFSGDNSWRATNCFGIGGCCHKPDSDGYCYNRRTYFLFDSHPLCNSGVVHIHNFKTKSIMRQLLTILLLVLTFCEATGQNSYTLDTYISAVLENDFGIKLMKNEVLISENENNPGAAGYLPTIGVTAEQNWTINSAR